MLNEHDITTWREEFDSYQPSSEETELYNVPRNTVIDTPIGRVLFKHLDGMYSLCYESNGSIIHLNACTPVKICNKPEHGNQN